MSIPGDRFTTLISAHLFLTRGEDILLLRRFDPGYEDGNDSVIAGHLDGGETMVAAIAREAREEAGIDLDLEAAEIVGVMHRLSNDERIDVFVVADRWTGEIRNLEPHKCDEFRWAAIDDLPDNVIPCIASAIGNWHGGT